MIALDKTDIEILELLQNDNRLTLQQIAKAIHMSVPPCQKRLQKLRQNGVIRQDCAIVDFTKVSTANIAFTHLKLSNHTATTLRNLEHAFHEIDSIVDAFNISGEYDFLIKIQINNMQHYSDIIYGLTEKIPEIINFNTEFVIKTNKRNIQAPISTIVDI